MAIELSSPSCFFFCCNEEGDGNFAAKKALLSPSFWFCFNKKGYHRLCLLSFFCSNKKGDGSLCRRLLLCAWNLLWFYYSEKKENDNFHHLLWWLCYKIMAMGTTFAFFGGFVVKKVTTAMSLPSSMVVVLWKIRFPSFFFFLFLFFSFGPFGLVH